MKKFICISVSLLLFVFTGFAKEKENHSNESRNYFYTNPCGLFYSTLELGYEHDMENYNSMMFIGGLTLMEGTSKSRNGGSGEFQYRINMSKHPDKISDSNVHIFTFFCTLFAVFLY